MNNSSDKGLDDTENIFDINSPRLIEKETERISKFKHLHVPISP